MVTIWRFIELICGSVALLPAAPALAITLYLTLP